MTVLQLVPVLKSGVGRFIIELSKGLIKRGIGVELISHEGKEGWREWRNQVEDLKSLGVPIHRIDFFDRESSVFWKGVQSLLELLENRKNDIILHAHSGVPAAACVIARDLLQRHLPIVVTFHGWGLERPPWMDLWDIWAFNRVDIVCFVSQSKKDSFVRNNFFENKYCITDFGVTIEDELPKKEKLREKLFNQFNVPLNSFVISNLSAISRRKNQLELVKAFAKFSRIVQDSVLFIIGEVESKEYFSVVRGKLVGVEEKIFFTGKLEDPHWIIKASDLFIFPTKSEGLSMALQEAMYLGVPCISTEVEGTKDLVCGGKYALVLDNPSEGEILRKMLYAYNNYSEMLKMAERARRFIVKNFSFDRTVEEYVSLYKKLLSEKKT